MAAAVTGLRNVIEIGVYVGSPQATSCHITGDQLEPATGKLDEVPPYPRCLKSASPGSQLSTNDPFQGALGSLEHGVA